ncbi:MAG: inducible mutagenesis protein A [Pseudomonadota bacterium]
MMNLCIGTQPIHSRASPSASSLQQAVLSDLRHRIAAIEGRAPRYDDGPNRPANQSTPAQEPNALNWRFGVQAIDTALPDGRLASSGLHDIAPDTYGDGPAAMGFCLALLHRLQATSRGSVLWCEHTYMAREFGALYGPGLAALGIDPDRLILVQVGRDKEVLWAMEEGLRAATLSAVIGEVATADFTASRRLSLACADSATPALLLRHHRDTTTSAARTRWRVAAQPGVAEEWDTRAPGQPHWFLELTRCRGGRPGSWHVEWNNATGDFRLATPLADRTAAPQPAPIRSWGGSNLRQAG